MRYSEIEGYEIQGSREFKKRVAPPPAEEPTAVAVGKRKADADIDDSNSAKKVKTDAIIIEDDTIII